MQCPGFDPEHWYTEEKEKKTPLSPCIVFNKNSVVILTFVPIPNLFLHAQPLMLLRFSLYHWYFIIWSRLALVQFCVSGACCFWNCLYLWVVLFSIKFRDFWFIIFSNIFPTSTSLFYKIAISQILSPRSCTKSQIHWSLKTKQKTNKQQQQKTFSLKFTNLFLYNV